MSDPAVRVPATPSWLHRMRPGEWYRISGDRPDLDLEPTPPGTRYLKDNDPGADARINPPWSAREGARRLLGRPWLSPWHGSNGFAAITECWNGAVLATRAGDSGSLIVFGGGHNDYFGSDVHRFDIGSRRWSRISDGYVIGEPKDYGAGAVYPTATYPDGSPLPPHTYDYVQYDPVGNDLLLFKGQRELGPDVQAVAIPHLYNLDSLRWRHGPEHPTGIFNSGGWTTWDPSRRKLWGHSGDDGGGNGLSYFAPDGTNDNGTVGAWGPLYGNKLPGKANHNCMQIDHRRDVILVAGHERQALYRLDPERPEADLEPLDVSGAAPRLAPYASLEFSASLDRFVYYAGSSGERVHAVAPDSGEPGTVRWRWEVLAESWDPIQDAAAASRLCHHPEHVFGRFRIVDYPDATLAILARHVDSPVYAMRLDTD